MSVLARSFDYFPTYSIIALRLIKGKPIHVEDHSSL